MSNSRWLKIGLAAVVIAALYGIAGTLLGPQIAAGHLRRNLAEPSGLELDFASVRVNPFTLAAEFTNPSLSGSNEGFSLDAETLFVRFAVTGLWRRGVILRKLTLVRPQASLADLRTGVPGLSRWIEDRAAGDVPLLIDSLVIQDGTLRAMIAGDRPMSLELHQITLTARALSDTPDAAARFTFSARHGPQGRIAISAQGGAGPLHALGSFDLQGFELQSLEQWLGAGSDFAEPSGKLSVSGAFRASGGRQPAFAVTGASIHGEQLALHDPKSDRLLRLKDAWLNGLDLDVNGRSVHAAQVILDGGLLALGEGPWPFAALTRRLAPWRLRADRIETRDLEVELGGSAAWRLDAVQLELENFDSAADGQAEFSLESIVNQGAQLRADGWLATATPAVEASIELAGLDLRAFESDLGLAPQLELGSGIADAEAMLNYRAGELKLGGRVGLREVQLVDRLSRATVLSAANIELTGMRFEGSPSRAMFEVARVIQPELKVSLSAAGGVQPQIWFAPGERPPVSIERIEIERGSLTLFDARLAPPLEIHAADIHGAAEGLLTDGAASLQLEGRVNETGSGRLTATWQPREAGRPARYDFNLTGIGQPVLNAYASRFTGRGVEAGTLSAEIRYRFRDQRFAGRQHLVFDDLRLAPPADGGAAPRLPLDLAVALLQDADGRIDVTLPDRGPLDGPDFDLAAATADALTRYLSELEAAPFQPLGELVGIPGEELGAIAFEPGSAAITPASEQRLDALREALVQRPALGLQIAGAYSLQSDREALARQQLRQHIALATSAGPPGNANAAPPAFADPKVQSVLDEFAGERLAEAERARIKARFAGGNRAAYYAALFEALVANEPIGEPALKKLARYRAQSILGQLTRIGMPDDRLRLVDPVAVADGGNPQVKVALKVEVTPPAA